MLGYVGVVVIRAKLNPALAPRDDDRFSWPDRLGALVETWPVLLLMLGVLGGLFMGAFTPTEAGAVGSFLAVVIALLKRGLTWQGFRAAVIDTLINSAALFIIAIGASMLTRFIAYSGAGDVLAEAISGAGLSFTLLLIGIACVYLLLGMFLEPIGAMLLTLPILLPIIDEAGWNLIWFGVVIVKLLEIGMITPPVGLNLFVTSGVANMPMMNVVKAALPFTVVLFIFLLMVTYIPVISTWLPTLMMGPEIITR